MKNRLIEDIKSLIKLLVDTDVEKESKCGCSN
jgi:hypothetical protein